MAARGDATLRRVSGALVEQLDALVLAAGSSEGPSMPPSTARDLVGQVLFLVTDALQTLTCPTNTRAGALQAHLADRQQAEATVRGVIRSVVGADSAQTLLPQAARLLGDLRAALATDALPATVDSLFGVARLVDYLRGALVEAVAGALRFRCPRHPAALTEASRALAQALEQRHPGSVIEVRVPPATAVQLGALGAGPTHTRGTPPNVVETDPDTFCALATGLRAWADELAAHRVQASGSQVGALPSMLPVINLSR